MSSDLTLHPITIHDKDILTPYLTANKYGICDFSFSNIFMWRHAYRADYALHKGYLVILTSNFAGERHFFMPLRIDNPGPFSLQAQTATRDSNLEEVIHDLIVWSDERRQAFQMLGLTEHMLRELSFLGDAFAVSPAEIWDYLYNTQDLISLTGKKFHGKRNHINKFDSLYDSAYMTLTPAHIPLCLELLDAWNDENDPDPSIAAENLAVREALNNYAQIGLTGGCLFVDGKLGAFTLGQPLNGNVFVIHVEKALYDYEGIYAKINQCFAAQNCAGYDYINREEDMGIEGLRKAKMSYHPVHLLKKHVGVLPYGHR